MVSAFKMGASILSVDLVKIKLNFCLQVNWLSVDFNNWKDWEDDSDEDVANYDRFSEVSSF